jgi:hypothetical protein
MRRLAACFLLALLGLAAGTTSAAEESAMKAAYVLNFAKFIQWPDEPRARLRLCVLGNDPQGKAFDSMIGKVVRDMPIAIRRGVSLQEIPQCDLVFVPAGPAQPLERALQAVNGYPILLVAEGDDALTRGATVALIETEGRIVFEVDLTTLRQLGLQVSVKMLQMARKVH